MTKGGGESKEEKRDRSKEGSKEERKKRDSEVNNHALHLLNSVSLKAVLVKIIWERWNMPLIILTPPFPLEKKF